MGEMNHFPDTQALRDLLRAAVEGYDQARNRVAEIYYRDFRQIAERITDRKNDSVRPTALAGDVIMKLITNERIEIKDRKHLRSLAAYMIRHMLADYYRKRNRSGAPGRVPLEEWSLLGVRNDAGFLEVNDALEALRLESPRRAEVVELRVLAGCSIRETAETLGITEDRANRDFSQARLFLRRFLAKAKPTAC